MMTAQPVPYAKQMELIEAEEERAAHLAELEKGFRVADVFANRDYLSNFSGAEILRGNKNEICALHTLRLFEMTKVVFDPKEDVTDKLTSVYNALYNLSISAALFLVGDARGVSFYFAVRSQEYASLAGQVLESMLYSNFPGIVLRGMNQEEIRRFLEGLGINADGKSMTKGLGSVSLIPSLRDREKKDQFVQGMEKFINTMRHRSYVAVLLAVPLQAADIANRKHGYEELYSTLSPHAKLTYAYGENQSRSVNRGISSSFSKSVNESVSNSNSTSSSRSQSTSSGYSSGSNFGGGSSGDGSSSSWGFNSGSSRSTSSSYTSGTSFSNSISNSVGTSQAESTNEGESESTGVSNTRTLNFENKAVSDLMKRLEEQIARIEQWESYGLWEHCAYFFSDELPVSVLAATTYKAIMTGEQSAVETAHVNVWDGSGEQALSVRRIFNHVRYLVHPRAEMEIDDPYTRQLVTPTSLVSGSELSILLGFPRKSVAGVAVQEMAEFGRAVVYENKKPKKTISFGNIYHMGLEEKATPVELDRDLFSSHCLITGSSGSGKSYATYNLLDRLLSSGIRMLVIEPAKGEYKQVFGRLSQVNIFTTDANTYRLLRINPFQFPEKIHILSHIEQLLQIFNASWPLYAAMPALLKEAVVRSYIRCGWDLLNSKWIAGISDRKYPVFQDVLDVLPELIDASDYGAEQKGNYKGALLTRVQAMTSGITGLIFRKSEGIPDSVLFDGNTIVDLNEVGSEETIALLMGVLIMRLNEYRKAQRKAGMTTSHDSGLQHVTVLEEAHNLLKRTSKDQNQEGANMVGKSVEMICNSIKEMRTYGEGFLIIDQSPLALDMTVVENTSTKIILNTPSRDACQELGGALSLNENQTKELSRLNVGVAAVMQKGWLTPVLMKVGLWDPTKYEAPLQYEDPGKLAYVRSCMATELKEQIARGKYSVRQLGEIIRQSALPQDRKEELQEITALFQQYKLRSRSLSSVMLGQLFLEIIGCDGLFDVIPTGEIPGQYEISKLIETGDADRLQAKRTQVIEEGRRWAQKMYNALDQYVTVEKETKQCALAFMLSVKGEMGESMTNPLSMIYQMFYAGILS